MANLRLTLKYYLARRKKFVSAQTDRFTLRLDTERAVDVGQMLNLRKRIAKGQWEPEFLDACFRFIEPHETVLEVGTWIGPYSVLLAKHIVPQGKVIGFEPDPVAFRQCLVNLRLNDVANAHVLPIAISDRIGEVTLYTNRIFGNSGSSIIESNPMTQGYERMKIDVPCTTLDRMVAALGLRPTTVKMDIEGAEDLALEGARETLVQRDVKILLEVHHLYLARRGKSANGILRSLAELGKEIYFLENDPAYPYRLMEKMDPARRIEVDNFHVLAKSI
jgi:FkbM family methyltransferase